MYYFVVDMVRFKSQVEKIEVHWCLHTFLSSLVLMTKVNKFLEEQLKPFLHHLLCIFRYTLLIKSNRFNLPLDSFPSVVMGLESTFTKKFLE